jgi:uncharacterized phage-associated protein
MPSVLDVAAYILKQQGSITAMKLQKLVYYSQAWSLVWDGESLFPELIEAWADGPVVRELWQAHAGSYRVEELRRGSAVALSPAQLATVDAVLSFYGQAEAEWLSELSHRERPWMEARAGLPAQARCSAFIGLETMRNYYSTAGLPTKHFPEAFRRGMETLRSLPDDEVAGLSEPSNVDPEAVLAWLESGRHGTPPWGA